MKGEVSIPHNTLTEHRKQATGCPFNRTSVAVLTESSCVRMPRFRCGMLEFEFQRQSFLENISHPLPSHYKKLLADH